LCSSSDHEQQQQKDVTGGDGVEECCNFLYRRRGMNIEQPGDVDEKLKRLQFLALKRRNRQWRWRGGWGI
jgi:hypothetical protein